MINGQLPIRRVVKEQAARTHNGSGTRVASATKRPWQGLLALVVCCLVSACAARETQAATISVTNGNSSGAGSLADAITQANATVESDTIVVTSSVITLTGALPALTRDVAISSTAGATIQRSGSTKFGIFVVSSGVTASFYNLTILNGSATLGGAGGSPYYGGGVRNAGNLTLDNCALRGNAGSSGGAIYNTGTLSLTNCALMSNTVGETGPGAYVGASGGGFYNQSGRATLTNCVVSGNSTIGSFCNGGGFYSAGGTLTLNNCNVSGNTTGTSGYGSGFYIGGSSTVVSLSNCTVSNNAAGSNGDGGGLYNNSGALTLSNSTVSGNTAPHTGSGLFNRNGTLALTNCTVASNTAQTEGGGLFNESGTLTLISCTVSDNTGGTYGGGGLSCYSGTASLTNCTVANNTGAVGGGLRNNNGALTLSSCTVYGNTATTANASGGLYNFSSTLTLSNSIVVGNTNADVDGFNYVNGGYNVLGTLTNSALSYFPASNNKTGVSKTQLKLGALANNGGPTQTMLPAFGSPVINAGNPSVAYSDTTYDQRGVGYPRVKNGRLDVGAVETNFTPTESLVVTTLTDEDNATSDPNVGEGTSLREAINYANSNPDQSSITFQSGLEGGTLTLLTTLPNLATSLTIQNPKTKTITLARSSATGTPQFSILSVTNGNAGVPSGITVTLAGLTLTNGRVTDSSVTQNGSVDGGALFNIRSTLVVNNCTLANSTVGARGGGLYNYFGSVTVNNCAILGNTAQLGGGFYNQGGTSTINNSTIVGNKAVSGSSNSGQGGGIRNVNGAVSLNSCTITGNTAPDGLGSGIAGASTSSTTASNSIIVGNGTSDADGVSSTVVSGGYNLVGTGNISANFNRNGDKVGVTKEQLKLGALAYNGGPTQTCALQSGSLAVDAGNPAVRGSATAYDQRGEGYARVRSGRLDVGAYEVQNDAPVAADQSVTTPEDTPLSVTLSATDADNNPLTYRIVKAPLHGTLTVGATGDLQTYTPASNYNGPDSFTFVANDGYSDSKEATVTITVTEVNDAPIAQDDYKSTNVNTDLPISVSDLLSNDSKGADNESGQTLTVVSIGVPSHGVLGSDNTGTQVTYTPDTDFVGDDSFTYVVQDDGTTNGALDPKSATGTVHITVNAVNQAPVLTATPDQIVTATNTLNLTFSATDPDAGDTLTYSLTGTQSGMSLDASSGAFSWTPTLEQAGTYTLTVTVTDSGTPKLSASDTFTITVLAGGGGGTSSGGTTVGGTTVGGTTVGSTTAGGTDSGTTTVGGTTVGGTTVGGTTVGGTTVGGTTVGGTTVGGTTVGGTTAGGTTVGGTTVGGTTVGGTDSGSTTVGGTTIGGTTVGGTTAGGTTVGGTDSGSTSSGSTSSGGTSSGGTSSGGTSSGGTSSGGTSSGGTSSGGTSSGGTSSGGTTSGGTSSGGTSSGGTSSGGPSRTPHPGVGVKILREAERMYGP